MGGGDGTNPYHIFPISARSSIILEADPDQQLPLMYCIAGKSRMVLIDTGCASGDLKAIVEKYCNPRGLPILVVCTHSHHDHLGCNFRFADPCGQLSNGSLGVALSAYDKDFTSNYMKWSGAKEMGYPLKPFAITRWLADGEKVPLSDSDPSDCLSVLHMPGHGPDEIAVYDPLERRLFVGDIINRYSPICIFSYGASFDQFVESIDKLIDFVESKNGFHPAHLIMLSCGHIDENLHPKYLKDLRVLLREVISGKLKAEVLTSRVSAYNRGGEMWITVNTKEGEELSRADFLAGIGSPPDPKREMAQILSKRNSLSREKRFRCRFS